MIPNYAGKQLYCERVNKWHCLNPRQTITGCLTSNANPNYEQAMHQSLIHEVMTQETANKHTLTCEAHIQSLKHKLNALCHSEVFNSIEVPHTKGYCPVAPIAKEPVASSSAPAPPAVTLLPDKDKEKETAPIIASKPPSYSFSCGLWVSNHFHAHQNC